MSDCPKCGAKVEEQDNFCSSCGFKLRDTSLGEKLSEFGGYKAPANKTDEEKQESEELSVTDVESSSNYDFEQAGKNSEEQTQAAEVDRENLVQDALPNQQLTKLQYQEDIVVRVEQLEQAQQQQNQTIASLQYELQALAQKQKDNTVSLEAEREEINQINNQILELKEELQRQLEKELKPIKELFSLLGGWIQNYPEYLPSTTTVIPPGKQQTPTKLATIVETEEEGKLPLSEEEQLLKDYKDPEKRDILSKNAITVSATEESIDNSRLGVGQPVLKPKRRGNYWILKQGTSQYLVPSDTIKFNEYSNETLEKLFECQSANSEGYKDNFELLKPAKVSSIGEEKWQLSERGKLEFID
ncbi:zinc ribbon domain-containing protein [Okeania sp. KiyG1]|uniref:zinc ribbon domain-containing protein n=1 Tax=Okeania sp. KiyG1 TaxID=2720165 RepID=UPI0019234915|nr:zinc ribbon domain-containing protein [Okeania sp. KiyG1]GGA57910.1 hypothetical protein CYANOKiyG1_79060 [Okeania sp. KiyG1]